MTSEGNYLLAWSNKVVYVVLIILGILTYEAFVLYPARRHTHEINGDSNDHARHHLESFNRTTPYFKSDNNNTKNYNSYLSTTVTAFFLTKEDVKHSQDKYREWYERFLKVNTAMVIYTNPKMVPHFTALRGNRPTHFIVYDSFWDVPEINEWKSTYTSERFLNSDPERYRIKHGRRSNKIFHTPELYAIWNIKPALMRRVAQENPFRSEFFIWR